MIVFFSRNHLYVTVVTGFIKRIHSFSQIVKRVHGTEKVGNHSFSFFPDF